LYFGGIEAIKRSRAVSQGTVIQNQDFRKLKS
jgi:hypothetical protein